VQKPSLLRWRKAWIELLQHREYVTGPLGAFVMRGSLASVAPDFDVLIACTSAASSAASRRAQDAPRRPGTSMVVGRVERSRASWRLYRLPLKA